MARPFARSARGTSIATIAAGGSASPCAMVLSHRDQAAARGVHARLGEEEALDREGHRRAALRLQVEALVGEVREVHVAAVDGHRRAAVLVHARAGVEARRGHIDGQPVERPLHDHVATALGRPPLGPVHIVAVERDLAEPERARRDARRGERRGPCAVGRLGLRLLRVLLHTPRHQRYDRHQHRRAHAHPHRSHGRPGALTRAATGGAWQFTVREFTVQEFKVQRARTRLHCMRKEACPASPP